jgi:signal transduction histidine kinase
MSEAARILLIDDDEVDRKTVIRAFRQCKFDIEIQEAEDGESGLALFREQSFDCVLLDYHLPDMDGLQVLEEMHGDEELPAIPVVILTGEENVDLAVKAMKDGACDFLVKESGDRFRDFLPAAIERAMSRRRLFMEKEKAQASNAAKVEFLSHMSHELRTPLNAIIGFSEMLMLEESGDLGTDKNRGYAQDIHLSGNHLLEIINDILELSKIEADKYELDYEKVDLSKLIDECTHMVQGSTRHSGARLINNVADAPAHITADPVAIKKVLINILTNAKKFTPVGGTVAIFMKDQEDSMAILIEDTGIGISAEDLPHIMEPFVQAGRKKMRVQDGTGLGLPLSKKFIEMHGGRLEIESTLGKGTKVTLHIPHTPI